MLLKEIAFLVQYFYANLVNEDLCLLDEDVVYLTIFVGLTLRVWFSLILLQLEVAV